jgi:hypothetical protein
MLLRPLKSTENT